MQKEIDLSKPNYNITEQLKKVNNIVIIHKIPNESLIEIVSNVTNILNIELKEDDINKMYHLKPKNNNTNKIIITFQNKNKKR